MKAFLIDTPGYPWIEQFNDSENNRAAYMAWLDHYNGNAELGKCISLAKAKLCSIFYKNECSLPFEMFTGILKQCFLTLSKNHDIALSQCQQVDKLLEVIKMDDGELKASKVVIHAQYQNDFNGACAYFSSSVSQIHGMLRLNINVTATRKEESTH